MRGGVLSDLSIQSAYPEFQAPNLGLASALEMIVMDKHEFTGIKMPKDIKRKRVSRFPINDIANLSSVSNAENKQKAIYASTMGYRKKLGSSNFDLEDRQATFKQGVLPKMGMDFGMNQELKRKGGFVDIINAKSAISQEQLVSNLGKQNINVLQANKALRDSKQGLIKVESQLNSTLLSNLENAKVNSINENTAIAQDERFRRLSGGEVYYNALTQKSYYDRLSTPTPKGKIADKSRGENVSTMEFAYNITQDPEAKQNLLTLVGASSAEEYKKITGRPLPTKSIALEEEYIYSKDRPKNKKDFEQQSTEEKYKPEQMEALQVNEAEEVQLPMSRASKKDPAVKDLPKDVEGNIDLTEYIRIREQEKMKNVDYAKGEEVMQKKVEQLKPGNKPSQKYITTPTQFYEEYGKPHHKFTDTKELTPTEKLGRTIRMARKELIESYGDEFSNEFNQEGRAEQLFERFEQETQLNLPEHGIPPF